MQIKSRATTLREALDDWTARGLLPVETAERLRADLPPAREGGGFQALVVVLGALCLGFAAISFVAANWEAMSRLARVAVIFAALWAGWGATAFAAWRGARWWAEALAMLSCGLYGAAIMLVAQIYHIQGNAADAVFLWAAGTGLAAALLRAQLPLALATALFALWFLMDLPREIGARNALYLATLAVSAVLAFWTQSRFGAHLVTLGLMLCAGVAIFQAVDNPGDVVPHISGLIAVVAALLFSLGGPRWLRGFDGAALAYALAMISGLVLMLGGAVMDNSSGLSPISPLTLLPLAAAIGLALLAQVRPVATRYDIRVAAIAVAVLTLGFGLIPGPWTAAAVMLALFIWITRMGWRLDLRALRVLGIAGFVGAMLVIYAMTLGSLIGTAGFYLGAGVLLLGGALLGSRLKPGGAA